MHTAEMIIYLERKKGINNASFAAKVTKCLWECSNLEEIKKDKIQQDTRSTKNIITGRVELEAFIDNLYEMPLSNNSPY